VCSCTCKTAYDSSLTDAQWAVIEPLLPRIAPALGGRPPVHPRRLIVDTVLYVLVSGCAWRMVPHDLAPWSAAYQWFRDRTADGTWAHIHDSLRNQVRLAEGRDPQPTAAILDS
jgi:transposase